MLQSGNHHLLPVRKRGKRSLARLALEALRIQPHQGRRSMDIATVAAGPGGRWWDLRSARAHAVLHASTFLCCSASPRLSPASVVGDTAIADRKLAHWAQNRMLMTPSAAATVGAGEGNGATFNRVLSGMVTFRDDGHIAAEFLGWHGAALYFAEGITGWSIAQ